MDTRTPPAPLASPAALPSAAQAQAQAPVAQALPVQRSADGLALQMVCWPALGPARGRVQIMHGLGEHVGRYAGLA